MKRQDYRYEKDGISMNYLVFCPENGENGKDLPLLVYLHGAGERGENREHLFRHGVPKLIGEGRELPAMVLVPQCPRWAVWDNVVFAVKEIIDWVAQAFGVSPDRISLTGSSMGGFGSWMLGMTYPTLFAGIAPIAGGGMAWRASRLRTTPVLAAHGEKDDCVLPVYSRLMVEGVRAAGGQAELLLLANLGHNDGIDYAYRSTSVLSWLLEQRRSDFSPVAEICEDCF